MRQWKSGFIVSIAVALITLGCQAGDKAPSEAAEPASSAVEVQQGPSAVAELMPRAEGTTSGQIRFVETDGGVEIEAHVAGVAAGLHGLHLHEVGDCSAEDFTSAGGHFNPTEVPHGGPADAIRHAGDFGNIEAGEDGSGHLELASEMLTVSEGPNTVVGRAVILHEGEDDLVSQPTGAAGGRLACGVVELEG